MHWTEAFDSMQGLECCSALRRPGQILGPPSLVYNGNWDGGCFAAGYVKQKTCVRLARSCSI